MGIVKSKKLLEVRDALNIYNKLLLDGRRLTIFSKSHSLEECVSRCNDYILKYPDNPYFYIRKIFLLAKLERFDEQEIVFYDMKRKLWCIISYVVKKKLLDLMYEIAPNDKAFIYINEMIKMDQTNQNNYYKRALIWEKVGDLDNMKEDLLLGMRYLNIKLDKNSLRSSGEDLKERLNLLIDLLEINYKLKRYDEFSNTLSILRKDFIKNTLSIDEYTYVRYARSLFNEFNLPIKALSILKYYLIKARKINSKFYKYLRISPITRNINYIERHYKYLLDCFIESKNEKIIETNLTEKMNDDVIDLIAMYSIY